MEENGGTRLDVISGAVRKRRSQPFRRPMPDSHTYDESNGQSSSSPAPPSDDASKGSSDDTNSRRKEFNLNQCVLRVSSSGEQNIKSGDGGFDTFYSNDPISSEGALAPANWINTSRGESPGQAEGGAFDGLESEGKVKKVKLKVGGVTRTISSTSNYASESGSSKSSRAADSSRRGKQGSSEFGSSLEKRSGLQGIPWKNFSTGGFSLWREDSKSGKSSGKSASGGRKQGENESGPVRKSKRMPKKRSLDAEFDDYEEDDDEIRFVQKLKTLKMSLVHMDDFEEKESSGKKQQKLASVADIECLGAFKTGKGKPPGKERGGSEDTDYEEEEEEEAGSDGEVVDGKKKQKKKEYVDYLMENKKEPIPLTTRQRGLNSVEFPSGLPPAPPKKQKEKLTEIEQQLKKAEAAQRRRLQNEKASRESEAEAIRKILGQDSNRKKKEDKIKKRQEALAEERAANASMLSGNTIRWVMGPTGTVITFPNEMGLPKMFESRPCSYPPPRENCAGPCCPNPYKYRDAKTKLPLCSLHCYKALQQEEMIMPNTTSIC